MPMLDLITVSDYARAHGILPAQAASLLAKLGMIGQQANHEVPAVVPARSAFIGELEVVL